VLSLVLNLALGVNEILNIWDVTSFYFACMSGLHLNFCLPYKPTLFTPCLAWPIVVKLYASQISQWRLAFLIAKAYLCA